MITDRDIEGLRPMQQLHRTPYGDFISAGPMSVAGWIGLVCWILKERVQR
jgi:hypothetical protein